MATQIKVRGYHIDVFQHVNNARYLEFYESDRWACMDEHNFLGWALKSQLAMVAVNINVNYFHGVILGDELTVTTRIEKIGTKSALCYQQITRERQGKREVVSDAKVTFVFIDLALNKSIKIEGELREKLELLSKSSTEDFITA